MNHSAAGAVVVSVLAALGVARTQPPLAATAHQVKEGDDIYALPPPGVLHVATLGWDATAVDLIWAKLLVEYGIHWSEHREMTDIPSYVDAILVLEPSYAPMYQFVDTMLAYRPLRGTDRDARLARSYLERGTRERPDDSRLWMRYGQFLAFVGPSFLKDTQEKDAWRRRGAEAMGHAVELGADADRALSAATMLTRSGSTEAAVRYLEHAYAFTEHPSMTEVHEEIGRRLATLESTLEVGKMDAAARRINDRWQAELPVVSRDIYLLLGPAVNPAACAGVTSAAEGPCWRSWDEIVGQGDVTDRRTSASSP
ncbi:MAG TPA: hypothetical protein VKU41_10470 [Polyangiaceae bacterium]|nr:hypothetical protein [Polyangiaceae bacterium]